MDKSMQVNGMGERTREAYLRSMRQLIEHYDKSPDLISEDELLNYFIHRQNVTGWSPATMRICYSGVKFFFMHILKKNWHLLAITQARRSLQRGVMMSAITQIFRTFGDEYIAQNPHLPLQHKKTIDAIINCRSGAYGVTIYRCDKCGKKHLIDRSCGNRHCPQCRIVHYACRSGNNRHCPKCGGDKTRLRLKKQLDRLLPVPYFFLTFTIPEAFHTIFRSHQRMAVSIPRNPAQSFNFRTGLFGSFSPGQKSLPEHRHRLNIRNQ